MGNPTHFSLEVPKRASQLLRDFYLNLGETEGKNLPLKATFLLSMSMPITILPIERILKYRRNNAEVHMNDAVLNNNLAVEVDRAIDLQAEVKNARFFSGSWQYTEIEKGESFPNLAKNGLPAAVVERLDAADACDRANALQADLFCKILRNSLSHGGILYLDEHGASSIGSPVRKFAFVSKNRQYNATKLHVLRISMKDYRGFLESWTRWLNEAAMSNVISGELTDVIDEDVAK
nr:hypothetical protein [uncultured Cohaesibacter sp.]